MPSFDDLNPVSNEPSGNGLVGQGFESKESYTQEVAVTDSAQSETDSNQPEQRSSGEKGDATDFEVDDFRAGKDAFRAWRHGARVANGRGFFCAPPPDSKPAKNSDYLRMWVDELKYGGYGVIGLPMSDELWFNATGDAEYVTLAAETTTGSDVVTFTSTAGLEVGMNVREYVYVAPDWLPLDPPTHLARGTYVKAILSTTTVQVTKDAIGTGTGLNMRVGLNANPLLQLHGPQVVGSDNSGIVDLYGVLDLLQGGNSVETSALYNDKGAVYFNTTTNKFRGYNGSAWVDLSGGGGSSAPSITGHTQNLTSTSSVTYAHGLDSVPSRVSVKANVGGQFSDATYDGTNQRGLAWGSNQAQTFSGYSVFLTTSAGNIALGSITAVDATNVTISWADKVGSPTGAANLIIEAS